MSSGRADLGLDEKVDVLLSVDQCQRELEAAIARSETRDVVDPLYRRYLEALARKKELGL